jgi:hypothetical protein
MSLPTADVLGDLGRTLDAAGVDWYLFGAQAALLRGSRRSTADVDVTVFAGSVPTPDLVDRLSDAFALRVEDRDQFVARTRVIPTIHLATQMPVDIVLGGPGLEEYFLSRCERLTIGGYEVRVPLAEDLVVMKLLAGRSRDLDDAVALVKAGAELSAIEPMIEAIAEGMGEDDIRRALDEVRSRVER